MTSIAGALKHAYRLVSACLALIVASVQAQAGPYLVFDTRTGAALDAHMATTKWYPASLTKLMAAYVAFGAIEASRIGLDSTVTIQDDPPPPQGAGIPGGTTFTVEEALPMVLAASLKSATEAIGVAVSGSNEAFVAEMNATAQRLGMSDTHYVNAHGFYADGHVTTARDLAVLTQALIRDFPQYQRFFEVRSVTVLGKVRYNHNTLLGRFPGADGMKSGYVCEAGFNLVGTATREGRRLGAVVLGAYSELEREVAAAALLKAGFGDASPPETTVEALPRVATPSGPFDMRPYVCGQKAPPADLAAFDIGALAPLPRPRP